MANTRRRCIFGALTQRLLILTFILGSFTGMDSPEREAAVDVVNFEQLQQVLKSDTEHILVVNFWATWCLPCVAELPVFAELEEESADRNIRVLLVSLDFADQLNERLIPFVKKKGIRSEVLLLNEPDANKWIPQVDKTWSGAIPATLVLNKGKRAFYEGSIDKEHLNKLIKNVLK